MAAKLSEGDIAITLGIFEALKAQKNNNEFSDLVVIAGSVEFHCHKLIMSAVSGFFRGLLTSGMKEVEEGKVMLKSLSGGTFSDLLSCIYTGRSVITEQNLFDIWAAADLLEVGFLLENCKKFFTKSLSRDNCFHFCVSVRLLNEKANQKALDFIVENFESLLFSDQFDKLTFEEMKYVLKSEGLATPSEDDVIEVILRWVDLNRRKLSDGNSTKEEFLSTEMSKDASFSEGDNDVESKVGSGAGDSASVTSSQKSGEKTVSSSEILFELLKCSRYLLISHNFLVHTLENHELVQADSRCQALVREIYRYMAQNDLHQEWCPAVALHRQNSVWKNVLIQFHHNRSFVEIRCLNVSNLQINDKPANLSTNFNMYSLVTGIIYQDGCLYALTLNNEIFIYSPLSQYWNKVSINIQEQCSFILIGQALYMFKQDKVTMVSKVRLHDRVNQHQSTVQLQPVCQLMVEGNMKVKGATSIGNKLIVFLAGDQDKSYTVECYDLARRKSIVMEDQLGSKTDLITFRKDNEAFALQENGALWRIRICSSTDQLVFTQELQLWDGNVNISGAVLFDSQLFISGYNNWLVIPKLILNVSLLGVFDKIYFIDNISNKNARFVHAVLPKDILPL
ncbi:hypothetical protein RRG08_053439 [Elysia crispata]|uniref:BTB domain-containing protein n=1 Tax=Elysia crispata TaxID=231223 RepID=A0AAE0ZHG5_9GAST|nr:hypothetical protein RRG08_053439 [Elysia crispata]